MRDYFKKLRTHPGVGYAIFLTILGTLAGAQNESMGLWRGALVGALTMGVACWIPVLLSNRNR